MEEQIRSSPAGSGFLHWRPPYLNRCLFIMLILMLALSSIILIWFKNKVDSTVTIKNADNINATDYGAPFMDLNVSAIVYSRRKYHARDNFEVQSTNKTNTSYAYATLLCNDEMLSSAQVLLYSFKKSGSVYPFLFHLLPSVSNDAEASLKALGATITRTTMLDYPFPVSFEKRLVNKMCRYSKLHIWGQTQFDKIVYIDIDCIIVKNLDDAFKYPELSAVRDAGDVYNTGLFVLKPSNVTYQKMLHSYLNAPSYNEGDQGFINWFFGLENINSLPGEYNVMLKNQIYPEWMEPLEWGYLLPLRSISSLEQICPKPKHLSLVEN